MGFDPAAFWDRKILGWEAGRYGLGRGEPGPLERLADRASASLRFRLALTREILSAHVSGLHVVELGCGSALLAPDLLEAGAAHYTGIDISERAIEQADQRLREAGVGDRVTLRRLAVSDLPPLDAGLVFSLGLFDWLTDSEITTVFDRSGDAAFLHAIGERRASPQQWAHRLYVTLSYGWRTGGYVPRYHAVADIARLAGRAIHVRRDRRLSFGALLADRALDESFREDVA